MAFAAEQALRQVLLVVALEQVLLLQEPEQDHTPVEQLLQLVLTHLFCYISYIYTYIMLYFTLFVLYIYANLDSDSRVQSRTVLAF